MYSWCSEQRLYTIGIQFLELAFLEFYNEYITKCHSLTTRRPGLVSFCPRHNLDLRVEGVSINSNQIIVSIILNQQE